MLLQSNAIMGKSGNPCDDRQQLRTSDTIVDLIDTHGLEEQTLLELPRGKYYLPIMLGISVLVREYWLSSCWAFELPIDGSWFGATATAAAVAETGGGGGGGAAGVLGGRTIGSAACCCWWWWLGDQCVETISDGQLVCFERWLLIYPSMFENQKE